MEKELTDLEQNEIALSSELNGLQLQLDERQRRLQATQGQVDRLTNQLSETETELRDLKFSSREQLSDLQVKLAEVSRNAENTTEQLEGKVVRCVCSTHGIITQKIMRVIWR